MLIHNFNETKSLIVEIHILGCHRIMSMHRIKKNLTQQPVYLLHVCRELLDAASSSHSQQQESMPCAWVEKIAKHQTTVICWPSKLIVSEKKSKGPSKCLKKFIILILESGSILDMLSNACCMWCNHLSAAWCVTGNGRCRPISAGWPATGATVCKFGQWGYLNKFHHW